MKKGTARSWKESLEVNICWTATVSSTSKKKTMAAAAAMPIEKAMGIDPADRYQNADEFKRAGAKVRVMPHKTAGSALLLSCGNLFFRDVKYIVQVLLTFGIFFTPVFFEPAMLGAVGARVVLLNPLAAILEGFRLVVVNGHSLWQPLLQAGPHGTTQLAWSPWWLAYSAAWAVGGLVASALLFHRAEAIFAEHA